jgi:type II secretory ATPase GspE/PulE/Tfp pilus assembly ATPase PilB-like protein
MNEDQKARIIDEQAAQRRARIVGIPYFDSSTHQLELYNILSVDEIKQLKLVPLYVTPHEIRFGITNTTSQQTIKSLKSRFLEQQVQIYLISDAGYRELVKRYDPPKKVEYQNISLRSDVDSESQSGNIAQTLNSVKADDMLAYVVQQAYSLNASDIHLETDTNDVGIRFRVGGVLHPIARIGLEKYRQLISSLAVAANVSTNSEDAQTGHINRMYSMADGSQVELNLRVETVPTAHGMDIVLRLFNLNPDMMRLDKLGLQDFEQRIVEDIVSHPSGLMLIVGPTGSGKTTTLYSILNELNTPERKIITLEDPVEYNIKGVTQIPVDSRSDTNGFAQKFRAVLRLDPDCIMVGEIRDADTAKTALQSALTGHLVMSTYHASNAAAALTRMLGSIEENPLFLSAIRLVLAQRLVRRLDDTTKEPYQPDAATIDWITRVLDSMPAHIERPNLSNITLYKPVPSPQNPFGYEGQFAVRELLLMTKSVEEELKKPRKEITSHKVQELAVADGMTTMLHEGVLRALAGDTTLEEVSRVIV